MVSHRLVRNRSCLLTSFDSSHQATLLATPYITKTSTTIHTDRINRIQQLDTSEARSQTPQSTSLSPTATTASPAPTTLNTAGTMRSKFKDEHPFEKRKAEAERIRQKYMDRIPVCRTQSPSHHTRHYPSPYQIHHLLQPPHVHPIQSTSRREAQELTSTGHLRKSRKIRHRDH